MSPSVGVASRRVRRVRRGARGGADARAGVARGRRAVSSPRFLSEAAGAFKSALRSDPADRPTIERLAATLTDLGTRTKLLGSPNAAIEYYREASAVDGGYAPAFYNLGVVLSETNRHAEAMACYELAIKLNANDADSHCNLGAFYTKVFHHRSVSTFDRVPFQLTGELFLYGMALRRV